MKDRWFFLAAVIMRSFLLSVGSSPERRRQVMCICADGSPCSAPTASRCGFDRRQRLRPRPTPPGRPGYSPRGTESGRTQLWPAVASRWTPAGCDAAASTVRPPSKHRPQPITITCRRPRLGNLRQRRKLIILVSNYAP